MKETIVKVSLYSNEVMTLTDLLTGMLDLLVSIFDFIPFHQTSRHSNVLIKWNGKFCKSFLESRKPGKSVKRFKWKEKFLEESF